ncbi:MAG TPA: ABC transporter permease [Thermoclostridium sp.]|nr:ABC transporter permease [Thermoclostridium sp.]
MKKSSIKQKAGTILLPAVGFVAILVIWWLLVSFTRIGLLLPTPLEVLKRFIYFLGNPIGKAFTLPMHLLISLRRVLTGFCIASVAGIIVGISMGRFKPIEAIVRPIFELVRPIPGVAWIPLAIVWFGIGETAKTFIIFMGGFVNIVVNTYAGARHVDERLMGVAYMLGASKIQAFFRVVLPSCVPYIFAGMQVGLSTCWMAVLAAEMVSSFEGVGWVIIAGQDINDMAQIFVGIIAIAVMGLLLAAFMRFMERILCRWRERGA